MSVENLISHEAIEKMRELVESTGICMFATQLTEAPFHVCPMEAQQVDDEGCIWFFSGADSQHNGHIANDNRVQLLFSQPKDIEFLTVFGEAQISKDQEKIDELWKSMIKTWFPEGKDDPNLTLIKVQPREAHYWDTRDGKYVAFAKILISTVTGKKDDGGVEGDLRV